MTYKMKLYDGGRLVHKATSAEMRDLERAFRQFARKVR